MQELALPGLKDENDLGPASAASTGPVRHAAAARPREPIPLLCGLWGGSGGS